MNGKTTIVLARHGETLWNRQQRLQGQKDSPLTAAGKEQARRLRQKLQPIEIHAAYVSPLQRAVDTIQIVLEGREVEPVKSDGLKEIALGPWEGKRKAETQRTHAQAYHDFWFKPESFSLPGAETYPDLQKRVIDQLTDIFNRHMNQTVLVVTHWIAIKTALAYFTFTPLGGLGNMPDPENGELVRLIREAGQVRIERLIQEE